MLQLNQMVPDRLILDRPEKELESLVRKQNAHWFHASLETFDVTAKNPVNIGLIRSRTSSVSARCARPNKNNSVYSPAGASRGLVFQEGTNCGFAIPYSTELAGSFSFATRMMSESNNARTLLTMNPEKTDNYLFLNQIDGIITFKDQKNTVEMEAPAGTGMGRPCLIIAGQSEGSLYLRVNTGPILRSLETTKLDFEAPGNLFVGCRSDRRGITKTLGDFRMRDIFFWPDKNVLEPDYSETLNAIDEYIMWEI